MDKKSYKIIRKVTYKGDLKSSSQDDYNFWMTKTIEERIDAIEFLRQQFNPNLHGTDQRLQRVFRIIKRK